MAERLNLRSKIIELTESISSDVEHAECFYDPEMKDGFLKDLDELKSLTIQYYEENAKEDES